MATIYSEQTLDVPAEVAWDALRRVGQAHELFAPVLVDGQLDGDVRQLQFSNGMTVRERIICIDERRRRVAYTVLDEMFEHHSASMQIVAEGSTTCRLVWISDFLPDAMEEAISPLVSEGTRAFVANITRANAQGFSHNLCCE
ncbi:SRPBCC family protein [Stenotrophomonas sp. SY1]|uniref:SRPBCC family protein n=1 Tax=Stenotrophomonas sp. SY1 TaxID=477235 RepID=UPI001E3E0DB9|nr:SRPBCC family protein [Stenotrophomonas sp. SY1]MCD9087098.1 SRPBCC family protein [Stenotrophomonas sp. SY1]